MSRKKNVKGSLQRLQKKKGGSSYGSYGKTVKNTGQTQDEQAAESLLADNTSTTTEPQTTSEPQTTTTTTTTADTTTSTASTSPFPKNPSEGATATVNGENYVWNGTIWQKTVADESPIIDSVHEDPEATPKLGDRRVNQSGVTEVWTGSNWRGLNLATTRSGGGAGGTGGGGAGGTGGGGAGGTGGGGTDPASSLLAQDREPLPEVTPGKVAKVGKIKNYEQFVTQFNESPGAQDHGITVEYDPETGEYIRDNSGMGFTGNKRYTRLSPEEMAATLGTTVDTLGESDDPKFQTQDEDVQTIARAEGDDEATTTPETEVTPGTTTVTTGDVTKGEVKGDDVPGLLSAVRDLPLFKSGDGTVEYDPETDRYILTAFGFSQKLTIDELEQKAELDLSPYKKGYTASYTASTKDPTTLDPTTGASDTITKGLGTSDLSFEERNKVQTAERDAAQEQAAKAMAAERAGVSAKNLVDQYMEGRGEIGIPGREPTIDEDGNIRQFDFRTGRMTIQTPKEFAVTNDLSFGKEYAEGVTTEDRTKVDPSITLDKKDITTSEGEQISPEEIAKLREIAKGRGLDIQQLRDEKPELFEQAKYRTAKTGTAQTREAAQLEDPVTLKEAEADYIAAEDVAPGEADTIIAPPDFKKIGERKEQKGYEAEGDAQLIESPDKTGLVGRKAIIGTLADAEKTKIEEFDKFTAAKRFGKVSEGIDPTQAATMAEQQADEVLRGEKQTVDIADAIGQTVNLEDMPEFKRISKRTAQTGDAAIRIGERLVGKPPLDLEGREAILGEPPEGDAAQIKGVPTLAAATMQAVSADERKMAAADMLEVVAKLPPEITAAVIDDPREVQAQLDINPDPEVAIALTALPQEALVSVQMEGLLAGMEGGETPLWARPAVAQVEQMMAQRGLSVSTVGRDALFNAIIQSAMPIAQSNAQALQQHASQKLSNEQQSGVEESKQIMQIRMQNLSNRQVAASQTVQMANEIKAQQGTLDQQAIITEAQQGQEARMATGQFAQQRSQQESAQRQQAEVEILSAAQQTEFENLKAESFRSGKQMDADQQVKLASFQAKVNRRMRQAELQNDMNKAELSGEIQVELAHISEKNAAEKDTMTAENQERLTKLTTLMDFKKTNAQLAQEMSKASLSNEQQIRMAELAERAAEDSANFTTDNQYELTRLQNYTKFMSQNADILQQTEIANFSQEEKFELADLASRNQAASENLTSRQQTSLANLEGRLKKATLDAQMKQEVITQTFSQEQQTDLANLEALNRADADTMTADQQTRLTKYNANVQKQITQAQLYQDMEKVNLDKDLQLELTNLTNQNIASKDTMSSENQERLVNLQNLVDFKKNNATLSQQMELANVSNEQQMRFAELQNRAEVDSANFTEDNRFELAELTAKVQRNVRQAELNSRMEEVNLDSRLKIELAELSEKNVTERANMTADQQMRLTKINTLMDFKKTNANLAQQMELANLGNEQQIEMAELADRVATDTANFTEGNRVRSEELQTFVSVMSQNEQLLQQADLANLSMEEKISLANLSSRSQADMASMSAQNIAQLQVFEKKMQAGQLNAQLAQQMGLANLSNNQQASMFNAQIDANLDMKQFDADQQVELANSQFMQTMTVKDFDANQQSAMQNATAMASMDMAAADHNTKLSIENARNFLQMDMANLANDQQARILDAQQAQQLLLSNLAAENASKQFNATSENQMNQFMTNLASSMSQFNASQSNAMEQFNSSETNRLAAIDAGNALEADKFNNQIEVQVDQFNANNDLQREQWSAANAQAVEQANVSWRRQANTMNTAAQNAANQVAVQQAFSLSAAEQTFLWQQLSDESNYLRQAYESEEQRKTTLFATALANESDSGPAGTVQAIVESILSAIGG